MGFNIISAAEAASYIKHGYNIGLSGFTPAGTPKAVTPEVAKIAEEEHAKGNPFQISIFTGASTGDATDGILSRVKAIRYRAPYTTNPDFRKAVNNGLQTEDSSTYTAEIAARYARSLFRRRGFHPYEDAGGKFSARLLRVEQDGRFVLEDENGKEREYLFKEVQYII